MNKINKLNLVKDLGFIKTGVEYFKGKKKYFSTSSVKEKLIREEGLFTFDEKPSRANRIVKKDDILQARMQNTNKALLINDDLHENLFSTGFFQLRPPKDKVLSKFIYYWLFSQEFNTQKDRLCSGSTQKAINDENLSKINLLVPSITLQQKIVAKLDKIFAEIDKATAAAEANIKNSESLFESYLTKVFQQGGEGWTKKKLIDICEKITDGTHQTPKYFGNGIIFLSSKNVTSGIIDWNRIRYIDEKQHIELSKRVSPKLNDILLAKNGTTGVAAIVDRDLVFDIYVSLALLRPKKIVLPKFLLYFINSSLAKKQFNKRLKGIGVQNLHLEEIREVEINLPVSLDIQEKLVLGIQSFLKNINHFKVTYENKKNELIVLKHSILQQAFNGELVKAA